MPGAPSVVLLFVVLAAFLAQTFAIHTHVHLLKTATWPNTAGAGAAKPTPPAAQTSGGGLAPDCFLCGELAIAGNYVLPDGVVLVAAASVPFWLFLIAPAAIAVRPRSPRWRSRAPPQ